MTNNETTNLIKKKVLIQTNLYDFFGRIYRKHSELYNSILYLLACILVGEIMIYYFSDYNFEHKKEYILSLRICNYINISSIVFLCTCTKFIKFDKPEHYEALLVITVIITSIMKGLLAFLCAIIDRNTINNDSVNTIKLIYEIINFLNVMIGSVFILFIAIISIFVPFMIIFGIGLGVVILFEYILKNIKINYIEEKIDV